ncbi:MAG: hypothetical protein ACREEE_01345, partial [Dongiaceae bacterium]
SRLIEGTARQMADQFFGAFAGLVGAAPPAAAPTPALAAQAQEPAGLKPAVWVTGLIIVVVILLLFFASR